MANNYKTGLDINVRADVYNPASPTAACVADGDWSRGDGVGDGHKVLTPSGYVRPNTGDYIVAYNDGTSYFVIDATSFAALFVAL